MGENKKEKVEFRKRDGNNNVTILED